MTLYVADIASYQGTLTLAALERAGFGGINVKVSHGVTRKSVHPAVGAYVREARARGWALSSFHFLDASTSGAAQAVYAHAEMTALNLVRGAVHVVDCEWDAPREVYEEYVSVMTALLGRSIVTYSGRWWWVPRGWPSRTPWLWSAPAAGYQGTGVYPGDVSEHWTGYGGWPDLAVMQYAVAPVDGIRVSMSAVRSAQVWADMTGESMSAWVVVPALLALRDEFNKLAPARDRGADGTVGDTAHTSASDHTPDEDSDVLRDHDPDSKNEVHALDIDSTGPWSTSFDQIIKGIVARERARWLDPNDKCRLKYVIWNRRIYGTSNDFAGEAYTEKDPHTGHAHFSGRYETVCENDVRPWGVYQEDIVEQADIDKIVNAVVAKLAARLDALPTAAENASTLLGSKYADKAYPGRTVATHLQDMQGQRDYQVAGGNPNGDGAMVPKDGSWTKVVENAARETLAE